MLLTRRRTLAAITVSMAATVFGTISSATSQLRRPRLAVVTKFASSQWFNLVEAGIRKAAQKYNVDAWAVRPLDADAASQVRAAGDVIEQKIDALGAIPADGKPI